MQRTVLALMTGLMFHFSAFAQDPHHAGGPEDASGDALEEVLVTAEFRPVSAQDTAASISVFNQRVIEDRTAVYVAQLLNLAPNVNFASGASRGRFLQIRGIGERSQFVEPINPSVGLLVDGMDFTGIAGVASTFDLQQVEILRGPQGTLFGANALAGMINMVSNAPGDEFGARVGRDPGQLRPANPRCCFWRSRELQPVLAPCCPVQPQRWVHQQRVSRSSDAGYRRKSCACAA